MELIKEVIKAMAVEAAIRAAKQAAVENKTAVVVNHVENMLLQLVCKKSYSKFCLIAFFIL